MADNSIDPHLKYLFDTHAHLITNHVDGLRKANKLNPSVQDDDLINAGQHALVKAAIDYNPDHKSKISFYDYAGSRVKYAIQNANSTYNQTQGVSAIAKKIAKQNVKPAAPMTPPAKDPNKV